MLNIIDLVVVGDLRIEAADVVAIDASIDLQANRILFVSGAAETINVSDSAADANPVILDAITNGDLTVNTTQAIELLDLNCDNLALATINAAGSISVTASGNITVSDDIVAGFDGATTSTGSISLSSGADIYVNDVVLTDGTAGLNDGNISLAANNDIFLGVASTLSPRDNLSPPANDDLFLITTIFGNVTLIADADLDSNGAGGELRMVDDSRIVAGRDSSIDYNPNVDGLASITSVSLAAAASGAGDAQVLLFADENLTVGSVQSINSTQLAIRARSLNGGIVDAGDTHIDFLANFSGGLTSLFANQGIGDSDGIETSVYALDARNTDAFLAATGDIWISELASGGDLLLVNADNAANTGDVRIEVLNGLLRVVDALFTPNNGLFAVSVESGNVLLTASGDVIVDSAVTSVGGNVTLAAGDDVDVNSSISAGLDVYVSASNSTAADGLAPEVDGVNIDQTITSTNGSILIRSQQDIRATANIVSTAGDVGLVAAQDVLQNADILAAAGSVLIDAGRDYSMSAASVVTALSSITAVAGREIQLARHSAANVGLSAGTDISDANGNNLNVAATNLSMRAGGFIGAAAPLSPIAQNPNAIDIAVSTLAASSVNGIYVQEDNDIIVTHVNAISVTVNVNEVQVDGSLANQNASGSVAALDDLTSGGPVKLVTIDGSIQIDDGTDGDELGVQSTSGGDILLEARRNVGSASNIITTTAVTTNGGNISLLAADGIDIGDDLVTSLAGSIFVIASNGNLTVADSADVDADGIRTATGEILLAAFNDISLTAPVSSTSGNIGLIAGQSIFQLSNINTGGDVFADAGLHITMSDGTNTTGGAQIIYRADGDITLGELTATRVGINAGGNILDGNIAGVDDMNVTANDLIMVAGGSIGSSDLGNPANVNENAIDTDVARLAASSGGSIYVLETDDITVDELAGLDVTVNVSRVNFNSTTSPISVNRTAEGLDDLTAVGNIKLVTQNGTITITMGITNVLDLAFDEFGVESTGAGDILLEARGAGNDVITGTSAFDFAGVSSQGGHINLIAADSVQVGDDLTTTGNGSIYVEAGSGAIGISDSTDGDADGIRSVNGDILLRAATNIALNGSINSTTGDLGFAAGQNITVSANVTTGGSAFFDAGLNLTQTGSISASNLSLITGGSIVLGFLSANSISIDAAGNILDGNSGLLNISANALVLQAGGIIGGPDLGSPANTNLNAIDVAVSVLSAESANGIYIQELNAVSIDVVTVNVSVDVQRVNFNSSTTPINESRTTTLDDLTSGGPIKLVSLGGSITVRMGITNILDANYDELGIESTGSGDILLEARGVGSDVITSLGVLDLAGISSQGGHISLIADDSIFVGDDVTTTASGSILMQAFAGLISVADSNDVDTDGIRSVAGDILLRANTSIFLNAPITSTTGDVGLVAGQSISQVANITTSGNVLVDASLNITMFDGTITAGGSQIVYRAGGNIFLGGLSATVVGISAGGSILDGNMAGVDEVNVTATQLSMRAGGSIGAQDGASTPTNNLQAIDTQVEVVAAQSTTGIYIQEADDIRVSQVSPVSVQILVDRVNFNSSLASTAQNSSVAALADLTSSSNAVELISQSGSIVLQDGNADRDVIFAGLGNVQLSALGHIVSESIFSTVLAAPVSLGANQIVVADASGVVVGDRVVVYQGTTKHETAVTAITGTTLTLANPLTASFSAGVDVVLQSAVVQGQHLRLNAGEWVHLPDTNVRTVEARILTATNVNTVYENMAADALGQEVLDQLEHTGVTGGQPLTNGSVALSGESFGDVRDSFAFTNRFSSGYSLLIRNSGDLIVMPQTFGNAMEIVGDQPGVYIETKPGGKLTISGSSLLTSTSADTDPGIVLISGAELVISGQIITSRTPAATFQQVLNTLNLNETIFDGGQPVGNPPVSTQFIINDFPPNGVGPEDTGRENLVSHVLQRILMEFGSPGEAGFMSVIHYADGNFQVFDGNEDLAHTLANNFTLDTTALPVGVITAADAAGKLFARATSFTDIFLNENPQIPTDLVLRRSLDFFMFSTNGGNLIDEASLQHDLMDIVSDGNVSPSIITETVVAPPPIIIIPTVYVSTETPIFFATQTVELPSLAVREIEVAIYAVSYNDINMNGQVDANELPTFDEVLRQNLSDESQREAIPINPSQGGEEPTPEDIERKKLQLREDPSQPSGAYAIIKKDADGIQTVLEVFSLRDWTESQGKEADSTLEQDVVLPKLEPFDIQDLNSPVPVETNEPDVDPPVNGTPGVSDTSLWQSNRSERPKWEASSSGLLMGTLWMLRARREKEPVEQPASPSLTADDQSQTNQDFGRTARRKRFFRNI
ncbi:MAG: hypothetical protein KDB03_21755 [Planctomycetales bacterium]|nr:hypothetical protein [Planctomycetales bacterium]